MVLVSQAWQRVLPPVPGNLSVIASHSSQELSWEQEAPGPLCYLLGQLPSLQGSLENFQNLHNGHGIVLPSQGAWLTEICLLVLGLRACATTPSLRVG